MAKQVQVQVIRRGFQGFRQTETISKDALKIALEKMAPGIEGHYIYWTGNNYNFRRPSLRSNALRCVRQKKVPVKLSTWIATASHCAGENIGYDPGTVRQGLKLHQGAKPCVYFELVKDAKGNFVAANDIPNADGYPKGLKAGAVVIPANGEPAAKQLPKGKKAAQERLTENGSQEQPSAPPANEPTSTSGK